MLPCKASHLRSAHKCGSAELERVGVGVEDLSCGGMLTVCLPALLQGRGRAVVFSSKAVKASLVSEARAKDDVTVSSNGSRHWC